MINDLWFKNTVVYSIEVAKFMDANGDGVGDFEGLSRRLDYLSGLGVGCIWLLPFQPTPYRDNGYDITDYYGVDPRYGNLGDFVEFTHQAGQRGIRVIIDLVINHTSDQHPWFQEARRDRDSRFRQWYVWSKKKPKDADSGMVFPGVQETTWSYDKAAKEYYFHRFYDFQPDLNIQNPDVWAEIKRIMNFWLELGVSGFRVDAVPFIIETQSPGRDHEPDFDYLHDMRDLVQWRTGDAILLGEANVLPEANTDYFGTDGDRMHMMFNFLVNQNLFYGLASGDSRPLSRALRATKKRPENCQWAHFLRNHDELDLGRLEEDQRQLVFEKFGPEPRMQLYDRGIRRRLTPMLGNNRRHLELAYSLMFTLPGTPVIRYGDEIGMGDNLRLRERNAVRTPMQWSDEPNGGFSTAEKTIVPVIERGIYGFPTTNVGAQRRDPHSLLNWTERMIRMRKETPEIGWGEWSLLGTGSPSLLAMRYDWRGSSVVILHNLDDRPHTVKLTFDEPEGARLVNLLTEDHSVGDRDGRHIIAMNGRAYRWYRLGGLTEVLQRRRN